MKLNLAFDMDGVITSQLEAIQIQALTKFKIPITGEMITEYGLSKCTPLSKDQEIEIFSDKNTYKLMPLLDNSQTHLQALSKKHTIYILTARYSNLFPTTSHYLQDNGVPWDYMEMHLKDKAEWFKKNRFAHPISLYVDDKVETVIDIVPYVTMAVLFDMGLPYTANAKLPDGAYRAKSWKDIMGLVKILEGAPHG